MIDILMVVGARPNFMKVGPLFWEAKRRPNIRATIVHTGQHYDEKMSGQFFDELGLPRPELNLQVGSASHAVQTAEVMKRFEPILIERRPDAVLVVGDVNSTLACALTAVKLEVRVAHVEAGLRSFDRSMPEEINRILTDAISEWLFVSERSGVTNLLREGVPAEKIHFVGNVMIDTLLASRAAIARSSVVKDLGLTPGGYAVVTLHRPSNVDDPTVFAGLIGVVQKLQKEMPVVFPMHPRARKAFELITGSAMPNLRIVEPLGYLDFMRLIGSSRIVLTDSGGIQEETTVLGIRCLTLRDNTERPVTVENGTNVLVGSDPAKIWIACRTALASGPPDGKAPELWDGNTALRILDVLESKAK